ncbi:helix-turn-helix transcriptional regulator, partial [Acinetobacter baumannii]|nr:helix-turn-helix transcriptional regulator [Acinetobacter baumannii]
MFKEKMVYYRKKNMMTQEDLAERLCVSRQTITKWESGDILPSLEYLINLSDIFHVTIDSLVKEDDCIALEQE